MWTLLSLQITPFKILILTYGLMYLSLVGGCSPPNPHFNGGKKDARGERQPQPRAYSRNTNNTARNKPQCSNSRRQPPRKVRRADKNNNRHNTLLLKRQFRKEYEATESGCQSQVFLHVRQPLEIGNLLLHNRP